MERMETPAHTVVSSLARLEDLAALTKPRVVALIAATTAVGFVMGSGPIPQWSRLLVTVLGTALAAGGALSLNQLLEWRFDALMKRTRQRPVAAGRMEPREALLFGSVLATLGVSVLSLAVDPLTGMITALTVLSYLFAYTPLKRTSVLCTLVGAFPGALPPVTGWTAACGALGPGAWALFAIFFFWQLPHSLAVARLYRDDYEAGGFRILPVVDRDGASTRRQIVLNSIAMVAAGLLPVMAGIAGRIYGVAGLVLGLAFLGSTLWYAARDSEARARVVFVGSLLYIPLMLAALAWDRIPL